MSQPIYTYSQLKSRINAGVKGKIGVLVDARETINQVVRDVLGDIDMRSTRRKSALTPNLFSRVFEYASPSDIKSNAICGIWDQTNKKQTRYELTTPEEFMRKQDTNAIALDDADFIKKILVNAEVNDESLTIATLDALTSGGGTWVVVGDATNLVADSDDFVRENASLKYDIGSGATTTAGIKNTTLNTFNLTDYLGGNGAVFVWAYITSTTNLTNFILKVGNDTSNYYSKTITAASDGTAFRTGWNLLRFDLVSLTETGSVTDTAIDYVEIYMTKTTGKINESSYRFDGLYLKKGVKNNVIYYSKYGWQNSSGTYLENSTADSDLLVADTDEINLFIDKGVEVAGLEVDEMDASDRAATRYKEKKIKYQRDNPSDRLDIITTVAEFIRQ